MGKEGDRKAYSHRLRQRYLRLNYELSFQRLMLALKAGYRSDQLRDEDGKWTDEGGEGMRPQTPKLADTTDAGDVLSIFGDLDSVPLEERIAQLLGEESGSGSEEPQTIGATVTYSNATTGDTRIDTLTETLTQTLKSVMNVFQFIPNSTPRAYGTAVHSAFGAAVILQKLENVKVEFSFLNGKETAYGTEGSVRADVALRTITGEVIAIYDLKTRGARVGQSRADELRRHFAASKYTPVIELHILRGSRIKHDSFRAYHALSTERASWIDPVRQFSRT